MAIYVREHITAKRLLAVKQRAEANTHEKGLCARRTNRLHDMNQWSMRPAHSMMLLLCVLASALCGECSTCSCLNSEESRCRHNRPRIVHQLRSTRCRQNRSRIVREFTQPRRGHTGQELCVHSGRLATSTRGRNAP